MDTDLDPCLHRHDVLQSPKPMIHIYFEGSTIIDITPISNPRYTLSRIQITSQDVQQCPYSL